MRDIAYPGGLSELDFLDAYCSSTLRKPQVVADSALRSLVLASTADRATLVGLIAEQLGEACLRLTAVYGALFDRTHTIASQLLKPLPGVAEWESFVHRAATLSPEQMLRDLSLPDSALKAATLLRSQPDLTDLAPLVAAWAAPASMVLIPHLENRRAPDEVLLAGTGGDDGPIAASLGADERQAATLADLTADLSTVAYGFLSAYVGARRGAGRPS